MLLWTSPGLSLGYPVTIQMHHNIEPWLVNFDKWIPFKGFKRQPLPHPKCEHTPEKKEKHLILLTFREMEHHQEALLQDSLLKDKATPCKAVTASTLWNKHSPSNLMPLSLWPSAWLNPEQSAQPRASSKYAHTKTQHTAPLDFVLSSSFIALSASKLCTATERRHENKFNHISSFQERLAPRSALAQGRQ